MMMILVATTMTTMQPLQMQSRCAIALPGRSVNALPAAQVKLSHARLQLLAMPLMTVQLVALIGCRVRSALVRSSRHRMRTPIQMAI